MVTDRRLATTGWRILQGCCLPSEQAERGGFCTGPAAAGTGKSIGAARSMHPHLGKRGAGGGGGDEASSAHGPEEGSSAGQISSCCRIWREGDASAAEGPREFRASTGGDKPRQTCTGSCRKAPLPVMQVPQVNMILVKSLEALTGIIENLRNPDAGPPQNLPDSRNPGVEADPPDFFGYSVSGGWRSLGCRVGRRTGSRVEGPRRGRSRGDGGLRRGTCSRRTAARSDTVKGTQSCNGAHTDNTTAEEDAHRGASCCGAGRCPVLAGAKVVSSSHAESQRHGTSGVVATCMCDHPSTGKFLGFCIASMSIVAWACSSTHPGRHWPACFDQTCGYPGTADHLGLTRCTRDVFDSDGGDHDM